jgi:chromosome segregation ATPase
LKGNKEGFVNAVELPPIDNPIILAFLRLMNSNAPGTLQEERLALRQALEDWNVSCREHFSKCDAQRIDALLTERTEGTEQGKKLLREIDQLQRENGTRSSAQSTFQNDLGKAQQVVMDFTPVNRAISSLLAIQESESAEAKLRTAVAECKQRIVQNQADMLNCAEQLRQLQREYSSWQAKEGAIVSEIEELRKPQEERKQRSSLVWQQGSSTFGLVLPS